MRDLFLGHSAFTQVGNPLFARHRRNRDGVPALVHTDKDIASDIFCCGRNHGPNLSHARPEVKR